MARLELIKELRIRRKEIYSQLEGQFPELMGELEAIDKIISRSKEAYLHEKPEEKVLKGTQKGDMTWQEYVKFMLKEIGGAGKAHDVAKAIVAANSDVSLNRAKDVASGKLSFLLSKKEIKATKGARKKDGYLYETI